MHTCFLIILCDSYTAEALIFTMDFGNVSSSSLQVLSCLISHSYSDLFILIRNEDTGVSKKTKQKKGTMLLFKYLTERKLLIQPDP